MASPQPARALYGGRYAMLEPGEQPEYTPLVPRAGGSLPGRRLLPRHPGVTDSALQAVALGRLSDGQYLFETLRPFREAWERRQTEETTVYLVVPAADLLPEPPQLHLRPFER